MDFKERAERVKPLLRSYVEQITEPSKGRNMYICPLCGSGTGKSHTGAFSIDQKDTTRWKCFRCGAGGDILDLIGAVEQITEPADRIRRAEEVLGLGQNQPKTERDTHMNIHTSTYTHTDTDNKESLLPYFQTCQRRLTETDYLNKRGISEEIAKRFMLGYEPQFKTYSQEHERWEVWKVLIIPTSNYTCIARNTDPEAGAKDRYRKIGSVIPLNWKALESASKPIFIVEGEIDALSIITAGGEAIGLGSSSNVDRFINDYIKKYTPTQPLVLALDNDKAGQDATETLEAGLKELGIPSYRIDPYNGEKDANAALLADRKAFEEAIARAADQIKSLEEEDLEAERKEYLKTSTYEHIQDFLDGIAERASTPAQSTGFSRLDNVLDGGLYEGLYIIGAITSLGKTTLALQMADQIAESGRDVVIFSLEMARAELMSKSISRHTLLEVLRTGEGTGNAKTNRGITAGERWEHYNRREKEIINSAIISYGSYAKHIFIHEGIGDIGTDYIRETIKKHQRITGQAPVVLIDYIQILAPHDIRATDKQNTDKAVLELKRISRDFKIPVIGISSFNRASYREAVTLEAFKESGSLEYGSDVLIGLQLEGAGGKNFDSNDAKQKDPRAIELVILKNRNGRTGDKITYSYYPMFNYFKEV